MANKYANQIYEAIDILTDQKLRNLKLDCTVQAIVKDNTNADKGYYTIEIQDANQNQQIIARSNRIDYVYPLNSCVYVTIPQNNSALDKWILGSVEVETSELDAYYLEEERPVQRGAEEDAFDGALALAQLIGGGDMLIIDFKVKDTDSDDGDGKLSFKGTLKVGDTELVHVELNEDNIEGDPYFVDDTQRFTYKIPAHEYEITDEISFSIDRRNTVDIEIDKIYIGKSDNKPFTKLLTAKLLNVPEQSTVEPEPQEKIVFNFAAAAIQRLQLQAYYNGVAIENNVTYSWAFDDATMNHVISGAVTEKEATFSRNELWRNGTFNFTAAITYDGERVPITSSVSSINFPVVSINQSTAEETTTLTANLMVGSDIKENPWGDRTQLTYLWNDDSTDKFITRPKLKSGDAQNYTCTVSQQSYVIGNDSSTIVPQPEGEVQGITAITNGNALLVWDESNTFKNDEIVLSVTIYDVNGDAVCSTADNETDWGWLKNITWKVPSNSLYEEVSRSEGSRTLTITGKEKFDPPIELPQIEVTLNIDESKFLAKYNNRQLKAYSNIVAKTSFTATQQGMPGTNGSKYIVQPLVDYAELDFSVQVNFEYVDFEWNDDDGNYHPKFTFNITVPNVAKKAELIEKFSSFTINIENTEAGQNLESTYNNLNEIIGTNDNPIHLQLNSMGFYDDPDQYRYNYEYLSKLNIKIYFDEDESLSFISTGTQSYMFKIDGADEGTFSDGPNFEYQIMSSWNDSYSFQEYGFLAAAAPYIRVKPRVWDVELKQWLPEEGLSYSTQLMYTRNPEGISKVANTNEYHLTVTSIDYNTTNIIRLTVMLDGKKFTTYLPLVIGTEGTTLNIFKNCLDHPFFYVMYDSTSTVPFYRYKGKNYNWTEGDISVNPDHKYLIASGAPAMQLSVQDGIFANDGVNENFEINYIDENGDTFNFYVPILFANVTSLYDFVGEWDGESAKIGEDYVISPIAAFGGKDENNKFTGLVLGAVNDSHTSYEEEFKGMIGYYQNQRTFELNATNGMAKFGRSGKGQIVIDPKQDEALIYGGNYNVDLKSAIKIKASYDSPTSSILSLDENSINFKAKTIGGGQIKFTLFKDSEAVYELDVIDRIYDQSWETEIELDVSDKDKLHEGESVIVTIVNISNVVSAEGMLINLTKPSIEWGNEKFSVDKDGALKSTSGEIGGFTIVDDALYSIVDANCAVGMSTAPGEKWAFWAGTKTDNPNFNEYTGANAQFRVGHDGTLIAENANLIGSLTAANISTNSGLFTVNAQGKLTAIDASITGTGAIAGFTMTNNILSSGNMTIDPENQKIQFGTCWLQQSSLVYSQENPLALYFNSFKVSLFQRRLSFDDQIGYYFASNTDGTQYYWDSSHRNRAQIRFYFQYSAGPDIQSDLWTNFSYGSQSLNTSTVYAGFSSSLAPSAVYLKNANYSAKIRLIATRNVWIDGIKQSELTTVLYTSDEINPGNTITLNGLHGHVEADYETLTAGSELACHGSFIPTESNSYSLGKRGFLWSEVWAATGTIQTSDRNAKNSIETIPSQYLDFYDKLNPVRYKFNQNTSNRYHIGLIAQDVEKALQESNISTQDFAGFISYAQENGTGYGLRYDEFIALCIAKTQQQDKEISDLKSEIQELKTLISQLRGQEG